MIMNKVREYTILLRVLVMIVANKNRKTIVCKLILYRLLAVTRAVATEPVCNSQMIEVSLEIGGYRPRQTAAIVIQIAHDSRLPFRLCFHLVSNFQHYNAL